ncbi:MAG TPA: winged helix DNA-binding protein [Spirochaetales bacterium]|nr:winged helix DNA-binding protein [Spirochaetales bacterium]
MVDLESISRIVSLLNRLDERLKDAQAVGLAEAVVLSSLGRGIRSPSEIAAATGIGASNLSRILKTLEERGLVERNIDDKDKRRFRFALTPAGHETLVAVEGSRLEIPEELLEAYETLGKD